MNTVVIDNIKNLILKFTLFPIKNNISHHTIDLLIYTDFNTCSTRKLDTFTQKITHFNVRQRKPFFLSLYTFYMNYNSSFSICNGTFL